MTIDRRPTISAPDDDPHLWLEEIEGERALAWVERQNRATLGRFGGAGYAADRDTLTALLDRPDKIPYVGRRRDRLYNFWKDAEHPRGLWRRTSEASYGTETPEWEVLLDLDALAAEEGEDWTWQGPGTLPGSHDLAILRLSRGGSDAVTLREFDLTTKTFVEDGFRSVEAKGWSDWLDRDTLLFCTAHGGGRATRAGYPRSVQLWQRGSDPAAAPVLFETDEANVMVLAYLDREAEEERIWYLERLSFFETLRWLGDRNGPKRKLDLPLDADMKSQRDWLAIRPRKPWTVGGRTFAPDTLLGIGLEGFLAGDRDFEVLFEPAERRALDYFFWCGDRLVLSVLDNLAPEIHYVIPGAEGWSRSAIEGLPKIAVVGVWPMDNEPSESKGDLLATLQDPLTPPTFLRIEPGKAPAVLKQEKPTFEAEGFTVTRHEAVSIDGVRIPYAQVGPSESDGNAPVHMTGYGGYRIPVLPYYRTAIGKLWLERGGTAVIANIRGGGEFGTPWHEAGRREGKRLSHDDFAAVADDLVRRGVTTPKRIAAEGGSNGGILITNMLTRYPERFGALFCTIPLVDMRRYTKLLAGASWIDEYGDPDKPEDWAFLQTYSAYHAAEPGRPYPPILLATTRRDDRVHPGHARKMAAKLQALGCDAHFYEPAAGGHGYGKDNREMASFIALGFSFLRRAIGWELDS